MGHCRPDIDGLKAFDTPLGKLGILICYDNEFPMLAHMALPNKGVELILAPSCTDTLAGAYRVRIGAQARALENQIAVLASPTVGTAPWSPAQWTKTAAAPPFTCPPDYGMPADRHLCRKREATAVEESHWLITDDRPCGQCQAPAEPKDRSPRVATGRSSFSP